ncbi:MAG: penicillin acylase family protein [Bacteroidales bacterium]|nr:penicillin acylase family protein [Bacteroidales bacterium]MCF8332945.1 penicillin acylase family protein [Bacteroidales bacterium]
MRRFKRILFIIGIILIVLLLGGIYYFNKISHQALPDYDKNISLNQVAHPVKVKRDSLAVPHVYAQNEKDLYTAVGYLMAQDRLWQMDFFRRVTQGRLSQIFGERVLDIDILMRSLRIPEKSELVKETSTEKVINALKAFSSGVNQYIESHRSELPPEFELLGYQPERWKPVHSINLLGFMAWDLSPGWDIEIALYKISKAVSKEKYKLLIPVLEDQESIIYPAYEHPGKGKESLSHLKEVMDSMEKMGLTIFTGSNNWAVSGSKSETGKPLLANDMHLGLTAPGLWYQMHQVVAGKMNVTGVVLPGAPFVISGHNDTISWGMTNMMVDDMDFYLETINPKDSTEYLVNSEWKSMDVIKEQIPVKGGDTIEKHIRYTHRGPIVSSMKDVGEPISMRWGGNEYSNELRSVYLLNHASDWKGFKNAVRSFKSVSQNIAYADIHGNIGMYCCGGVPIVEGKGVGIYPGDTTQYDWKGMVPFEELPNVYNPEKGYVSSANNKTVTAEYPYHISHWFDLAPRISRINNVLEQDKKFSVEDLTALQTDFKSELVSGLKPEILKYTKEMKNLSSREETAREILENWENEYKAANVGAAIFEQFYLTFVKNLVRDELGQGIYREYISSKILVRNLMKNIWENPESAWCDNVNTPGVKEQFPGIIRESFRESIALLTEKMGETPAVWQWGKIHNLILKHPLARDNDMVEKIFDMNQGPFEVGGSFHTVGCYGYSNTHPFEVNFGASQRHVYSTADWDSSRSVIPTGISGIPASEHYRDQTRLYVNSRYHGDFFSQKEVDKNIRYEMIIEAK